MATVSRGKYFVCQTPLMMNRSSSRMMVTRATVTAISQTINYIQHSIISNNSTSRRSLTSRCIRCIHSPRISSEPLFSSSWSSQHSHNSSCCSSSLTAVEVRLMLRLLWTPIRMMKKGNSSSSHPSSKNSGSRPLNNSHHHSSRRLLGPCSRREGRRTALRMQQPLLLAVMGRRHSMQAPAAPPPTAAATARFLMAARAATVVAKTGVSVTPVWERLPTLPELLQPPTAATATPTATAMWGNQTCPWDS